MIISRTPLRVSFAGGGTDLGEFCDEHGGAVVSSAIDKWIHVVVAPRRTFSTSWRARPCG
jgi:D-glycero-alpha-D-manno-heptose-7-phosphate kinase